MDKSDVDVGEVSIASRQSQRLDCSGHIDVSSSKSLTIPFVVGGQSIDLNGTLFPAVSGMSQQFVRFVISGLCFGVGQAEVTKG